jgi:hypothetical protein
MYEEDETTMEREEIIGQSSYYLGGVIAKVEMTTSTAACFWKVEIGRVAVYLEDHVTGLIAEYSIRMSGGIVKELDDCFHCGFCSCFVQMQGR